MAILIKQSEATAARRTAYLFCVLQSDGTGPGTGEAGGTTQILKAGGTAFANSGTLTALGTTGHYYLALPTADIDTIGPARLRYRNAGTVLETFADLLIVPWDPYNSGSLGLTQLDAAISSRSSHGTVDVWTYGTRALTDKAGFSLAADQSGVTIGTLNSYGGTVGTVGTLKTNADKSGYSLAADQSAVTIGTVNTVPAIGSVGTVGTLGAQAQADVWGYSTRAVTDKAGFSLAADQSGVTIGTLNTYGGTIGTVNIVGSFGAQAKADVNAEMVDVIGTDTIPELAIGTPGATPSLRNAVMLLYMDERNKVTQTGTLRKVFNTAGTAIAQATLEDTGTTFTKSGYESG